VTTRTQYRDTGRSHGDIAPGAAVPGPFAQALKHPRFMHYNRLIALVVLVNAALLARHLAGGDWHIGDGSALSGLADLTVVNLAIAVLIRQQHVLNVIFAAAGRGVLQAASLCTLPENQPGPDSKHWSFDDTLPLAARDHRVDAHFHRVTYCRRRGWLLSAPPGLVCDDVVPLLLLARYEHR
jgi:hypothetical protein